jgi:hypothetical protein
MSHWICQTEFMEACKNGPLDAVKAVIEEYGYVMLVDILQSGCICACDRGWLDIVTYLYENFPYCRHEKCILSAAYRNHVNVVAFLLSYHDRNSDFMRLNVWSAMNAREIIEFLLDQYGYTYSALPDVTRELINCAVFATGNLDTIKWIQAQCELPRLEGNISTACHHGHMHVFEYFRDTIAARPHLYFVSACFSRNLNMIKQFAGMPLLSNHTLAEGFDAACGRDNADVVAYLYETYPIVRDLINTIVNSRAWHHDIIRLLLQYGAGWVRLSLDSTMETLNMYFSQSSSKPAIYEHMFDINVHAELHRRYPQSGVCTSYYGNIWPSTMQYLIEQNAFDLDKLHAHHIAGLYDSGLPLQWFQTHLKKHRVIAEILHDNHRDLYMPVCACMPPVLAMIVTDYVNYS